MAINMRSTRDQETRQAEIRDESWQEPNLLQMPQAPHGYVYRWIRVMEGNEEAKANISRRLQEGWIFVKPEEVGEEGVNLPTRDGGRFAGYVGVGDVALAKIPESKVRARKRFYEEKTHNLQVAVDAKLKALDDRRMPMYNDSKTQVTKGRPASIDP